MRTDQSNKGNILHKLKSKKEIKKITGSKEYKDADYKTKTEMLGGRVLKKGGGMCKLAKKGKGRAYGKNS